MTTGEALIVFGLVVPVGALCLFYGFLQAVRCLGSCLGDEEHTDTAKD
jgi:hypothetical protein